MMINDVHICTHGMPQHHTRSKDIKRIQEIPRCKSQMMNAVHLISYCGHLWTLHDFALLVMILEKSSMVFGGLLWVQMDS